MDGRLFFKDCHAAARYVEAEQKLLEEPTMHAVAHTIAIGITIAAVGVVHEKFGHTWEHVELGQEIIEYEGKRAVCLSTK